MNPGATRHRGGCWPDAAQTDLLRVCLQEEEPARAAWQRWRSNVDFERVDSGSFRLLGLAYRRVSEWRLDDPVLPRLKGIYRNIWVRNQILLAGKPALLKAMNQEGIATMLLKGAALIPTAYRDMGVRPMDDLDVLVPHDRAKLAMELLLTRGWKSDFRNHEALIDSLHACHFRHPKDGNLDLHWHLMHADCRSGADEEFWKGCVPLRWEGMDVSVLQPADQLLHTCEHGPRFNSVPPLRWLADAWKIIHAPHAELDWDRLCRQAALRQLVLPVRLTLEWLEKNIGASAPAEIRRLLGRRRVTFFERIEYRIAQQPLPPESSILQRLPLNLCYYWRLKRFAGLRHVRRDLPVFMQHINNLEYPPQQYLKEHFRYLRRVRFPVVWNRLRHWRSASRHDIARIHHHDLTGFHLLEPCNERNFRWSKPESIIRIRRAPADLEITIDLGGQRGWHHDLEHNLSISFNTHKVSPRPSAEQTITFDVKPDMFEKAVYQRIILRCDPVKACPPETRQLGLPIFALRVEVKTPARGPFADQPGAPGLAAAR